MSDKRRYSGKLINRPDSDDDTPEEWEKFPKSSKRHTGTQTEDDSSVGGSEYAGDWEIRIKALKKIRKDK